MINAGLYGADGIILDLEDSVAPSKKHDARLSGEECSPEQRFFGCRANGTHQPVAPAGLDDLTFYCSTWHVQPHSYSQMRNGRVMLKSVDARIGELENR
jgi:hypothetical protein